MSAAAPMTDLEFLAWLCTTLGRVEASHLGGSEFCTLYPGPGHYLDRLREVRDRLVAIFEPGRHLSADKLVADFKKVNRTARSRIACCPHPYSPESCDRCREAGPRAWTCGICGSVLEAVENPSAVNGRPICEPCAAKFTSSRQPGELARAVRAAPPVPLSDAELDALERVLATAWPDTIAAAAAHCLPRILPELRESRARRAEPKL